MTFEPGPRQYDPTLLLAVRGVRRLLIATIAVVVVVGLVLGGAMLALARSLADTDAAVRAIQAAPAASAPVAQAPAAPAASASAQAAAPLKEATALDAAISRPKGSEEAGALLFGDPQATQVVEVFVDYQCPYCQKWEQMLGEKLTAKALTAGSDLLVKVHTLAFLGETDTVANPGASARAANAMACVIDADGSSVANALGSALFATADPSEPPGQFTTAELTSLAQGAGASDAAIACIDDQRFVPFVAAVTKAGFARGVDGTPTVVVNGTRLESAFSSPELDALTTGA